LLIPATIYPWNLTAGITGEFAQSPLAHGWLILLSAIIAATTTVFGIVAGTYRNIEDIIKGASHLIATHAHSIAALIPAALFISMSDHLEYPLFAYPIAEYIFLLLPFLSDIYTNQKTTNK
jgi:p-aminobenzoyl-glutamate transporter AbgT